MADFNYLDQCTSSFWPPEYGRDAASADGSLVACSARATMSPP
jgi:hypothetical protein